MRGAAIATGLSAMGAGLLLMLVPDAGPELSLALACLVGGFGLLALAPSSPEAFTGAISRFGVGRPRLVWPLRVATVATAPAAGAGPVAYAALSFLQAVRGSTAKGERPDGRRVAGTGLVGLACLLAASGTGATLGPEVVVWAVSAAAAALSLFWWWPAVADRSRGQILMFGLIVLYLLAGTVGVAPANSTPKVSAGLAGAVGVLLVLAPRWLRTSRELAVEREERARADERADVAARVHDSVLQTLALIQSRADDAAEVKALARSQERRLRAQLFAAPEPLNGASIAGALRAAAGEVEDDHHVNIDVVTVGDGPMDEASAALVFAAREALANAARHAPDAPISLFGEVGEGRVTAFVRDRGPGFDLEAIPDDRRGVRESIIARMERHGGHAALRTAPGGGCEVRLSTRPGP